MLPPTPPDSGPGWRAEARVYKALQARLSDDWHVLFRQRIVGTSDAQENEIDALLMNRVLGMLTLECKGYGVELGEDRQWTRKRDGRVETMKRAPGEQALRQSKAMVAEFEKRMKGTFPTPLPFVHGYAVAFPFARADGPLPFDLPRELLCLSEDLERIDEWVERALGHWRKAARSTFVPLEPKEYARFRRQILHPAFGLVETLSARLRADDAAIAHMTADQLLALEGCLANIRMRVSGAAGTGKTALAVEAARRLACAPHRSVLIGCFNAGLAAHLAEAVAREGACVGRIEATTFHEFCRRAAESGGVEWKVPTDPEKAREFWDKIAPEILFDVAMMGKAPKFDAIVIDEAQDFHEEWSVALEACLKDRDRGALLVFYDPVQRIFAREWPLLERSAVHELKVNFRNTKSIARAVAQQGKVDYRFLSSAPEGIAPTIVTGLTEKEIAKRADDLVRSLIETHKLVADQIVVLSPHKRERSSLKGLRALGGVPLASKSTERAGKVLHSTISAFKGLEADAVILIDVDPDDARCDTKARYVAASRAKHFLFVLARGDWV